MTDPTRHAREVEALDAELWEQPRRLTRWAAELGRRPDRAGPITDDPEDDL